MRPETVAVATLVYTAYTLIAMALFGAEAWLDRGEAFSVYYGMFSQLAPLEVRDGRLGPPTTRRGHALGQGPRLDRARRRDDRNTTFDGAQEGLWQQPIRDLFDASPTSGLGRPLRFGPRSRSSSRSPWRESQRLLGRGAGDADSARLP